MPEIPPEDGDFRNFGHLSYLPGQRLSACTCPDDPDHPGPRRENGSFVGRGAPEIDMFEAAVSTAGPYFTRQIEEGIRLKRYRSISIFLLVTFPRLDNGRHSILVTPCASAFHLSRDD